MLLPSITLHPEHYYSMRRQCYGSSDAIDQVHPVSRALPIQMSPPLRERSRNCPITRPARRSSPQEDQEPEQGGHHTRKRINVAVTESLASYDDQHMRMLMLSLVRPLPEKEDQMQWRLGDRHLPEL